MTHAVQNPCGRHVNKFVRSSYDKESTNPLKDSMIVFLMGQIKFLGEIKIKNNIIERLLTLKSVLHENQRSSCQTLNKLKKITKICRQKS